MSRVKENYCCPSLKSVQRNVGSFCGRLVKIGVVATGVALGAPYARLTPIEGIVIAGACYLFYRLVEKLVSETCRVTFEYSTPNNFSFDGQYSTSSKSSNKSGIFIRNSNGTQFNNISGNAIFENNTNCYFGSVKGDAYFKDNHNCHFDNVQSNGGSGSFSFQDSDSWQQSVNDAAQYAYKQAKKASKQANKKKWTSYGQNINIQGVSGAEMTMKNGVMHMKKDGHEYMLIANEWVKLC